MFELFDQIEEVVTANSLTSAKPGGAAFSAEVLVDEEVVKRETEAALALLANAALSAEGGEVERSKSLFWTPGGGEGVSREAPEMEARLAGEPTTFQAFSGTKVEAVEALDSGLAC